MDFGERQFYITVISLWKAAGSSRAVKAASSQVQRRSMVRSGGHRSLGDPRIEREC